MKKEVIEIKNIQDIYDIITEENLDRFMLDFYKLFHTLAASKKDDENWKKLKLGHFNWKDDGDNNITINFNNNDGERISEIKY